MKMCQYEPCMCACVQAYVITALQMFSLDAVNASEFLEVYKGVVPPGEFGSMLDELTSGPHSFIHACQLCFGAPKETVSDSATAC